MTADSSFLRRNVGTKPFFLGGNTRDVPEKVGNIIERGLNCEEKNTYFLPSVPP